MQTCLSRRGVFGGHAGRRATVIVRAEAIAVPAPFVKVDAKGDRVLVKVAEEEVKTRGGILLPPSSIKKPTSGVVVGLGNGRVGNGEVRPFFLQLGQTVVYSKFGFMYQDLKMSNGEEYILIRENDIIGIMPSATADGVPELQPLGNRVLVLVEEVADLTMGGVILPETAKERPLTGTVVRLGPGKYDKDAEGKRKAMTVAPGDKVLYFKYAGDNMETPAGVKYVVLGEDDILCKA